MTTADALAPAPLPLVQRLGFIVLETDDFDASEHFYRAVAQLGVSERRPGQLFLTGGLDHHWIRLVAGTENRVTRVGFEVVDADALDECARRLDARGIAHRPGGDVADDRIDRSIVFTDLDDHEVELFVQMVELPVHPFAPTVAFRELLHIVWDSYEPVEASRFYCDTFGFRESDWIERGNVFLRAGNEYHHSLGMRAFPGGRPPTLSHLAFLVEGIDDVMRMRNHALACGIDLQLDIVRHAASGSMGVYLRDPVSGLGVEYCTSHRRIPVDEPYRARVLPRVPETPDVWLERPPTLPAARQISS